MRKKSRLNKSKRAKKRQAQAEKRKYDDYFKKYFNSEKTVKSRPVKVVLYAPEKLSLRYEYVEEMLKFIKEIKAVAKDNDYIQLHLVNVNYIGEGGIAMLLSVMSECLKKGVSFDGLKPSDEDCRVALEKSGFFNFLKGPIHFNREKFKNSILTTGSNDTNIDRLLPEVYKAMETVWGTRGRCPLLVGGIGEMMRNSVDHAYSHGDKVAWHMTVSHIEEENTVKFSFVDNGIGIIERYTEMDRNTISQIKLFLQNNYEILKEAFRSGIKSRTGLKWRGTGLPTIYEMYEDNIITDFVVITNDCYLNFRDETFTKLKVPFSGTYYYWIIDETCDDVHYEN